MTTLEGTPLLILGMTLCKLVISTQLSAENRQYVLNSPSVTISDHVPGRINVSWEPHLTEQMMNFTVKYKFFYKFKNKTDWKKERRMEKYAKINLKSHSNVWVKVSTQLFHDMELETKLVAESIWTEVFYTVPKAPLENLSCIVYNLSSLNCTWQIVKDRSSEDAQFLFAFRYMHKKFKCQHYFTNKQKRNVGCHMEDMYFHSTRRRLNVTVWCTCSTVKVNRVYLPSLIEKLNPPINMSLYPEEAGLRIRWMQPLTIRSSQPICFSYQVKLAEVSKKPNFYVLEKGEVEHLIPHYDKEKKYSVQVRAKKICSSAKSKYWGEWSEPVFFGKEDDMEPWIIVTTCSIFLTLLFVLLGYLWKRYGGLKVIFPPVPDPSAKLKQWFVSKETHGQNLVFFQDEDVATVEILTDSSPGPQEVVEVNVTTRNAQVTNLGLDSAGNL
ncbi:interleukin-5 receptor subunit alpha-like isoform X1 [Pleurodeles waltl]